MWHIMKVGIIAGNNLRISPYVFFYTELLHSANIEFEVVYPRINNIVDVVPFKTYEIKWNNGSNKLVNYYQFRKNVIDYINHSKYDFLIILTTSNAVILSDYLSIKYKNRYLVDIRDYTHENILLYKLLEKNALKHSKINVISSSGFRSFLPKGDYSVCHNISSDMNSIKKSFRKNNKGPIVIGYVGTIGYSEQCKRLINLVANDERFEFHFYGTSVEEQTLKDYVYDNHYNRVKFHGGYLPKDKSDIVSKVDILFNAYGNDSPLVKYALSNKLYDAFFYKKLLLNSPNTAMSEASKGISYALDLKTASNLNLLYEWYKNLRIDELNIYASNQCKRFLEENRLVKINILQNISESFKVK